MIRWVILMIFPRRKWKDIPGYEGLYQVSNLGEIKSLNYRNTGKEKIIKPRKNKGGYLRVVLCKNGKQKDFLVHRLVAIAFIPNHNNYNQVNHKDENPSNNNVNNLEWCNRLYNERQKFKHISGYPAKPIEQIDANTNEIIAEFESMSDCERKLHMNVATIRKYIKNNTIKTKFGNTFILKWKP